MSRNFLKNGIFIAKHVGGWLIHSHKRGVATLW
jgi:hypothetical protein